MNHSLAEEKKMRKEENDPRSVLINETDFSSFGLGEIFPSFRTSTKGKTKEFVFPLRTAGIVVRRSSKSFAFSFECEFVE